MAKGNEPFIGDRVHHEGRTHPTRVGWLQANGEIVNTIEEDGDVVEIVVEFGQGDIEMYDVEQLEWANHMGGYWRVT